MKIKACIKKICSANPVLEKRILRPYMEHCEKRRVRRIDEENYSLNNRDRCLAGTQRMSGTNFWFLLEQGHNNIGDIAIGVAERNFFEAHFPQVPMHFIYEQVFFRYQKEISSQIRPGDVIILRGGGSIGNTVMHEKHREDIIRKFKKNLIVSMPQTMCFPNTEKGEREKKRAAKIYTSNSNLLLIAREEQSYVEMQKTFQHTHTLLTPDIVMTLDFKKPVLKRKGILLCFRTDWERSLPAGDAERIEASCRSISDSISYTDMYAEETFVPFEKRSEVLLAKITQFKQASLVITDRLHGMVFSAITGTPCIALPNYNHKVEQTYKWLQDLPYIKFCQTTADAIKCLPSMYNCTSGTYSASFTKPYFEKIMAEICAYSTLKEENE